MQRNITPIFIIGSARNGTTNLENTIAALPQVAGVEHWLHYGSCESNLYMNNAYWGDLSEADQYINFLHQYASSDYFQLAEGDIPFHLQHKRDNFYDFFFDLMDRYAEINQARYWITKFDPHFFMDEAECSKFLKALDKRYDEVKYIRIQRSFEDAFKSYRNMEGKSHDRKQKGINLLPALLLQASRYALTYRNDIDQVEKNVLDLSFEQYISERHKYIKEVARWLDIYVDDWNAVNFDRFQINTSYVKQKTKRELPNIVEGMIPKLLQYLSQSPAVAQTIWKVYFRRKTKGTPTFNRLIKHAYLQEDLLKDLTNSKANGLIQRVRSEDTTTDT
jgi:hypothetical protein